MHIHGSRTGIPFTSPFRTNARIYVSIRMRQPPDVVRSDSRTGDRDQAKLMQRLANRAIGPYRQTRASLSTFSDEKFVQI